MTERYFPFTSVDDDRLYASADFRSFINSILGSGRCDYEEFNILAVDSLQCSIDSLELDTINISAGACIIKGAGYQSSSAETRIVNLPTGSDIYNGYVIARLDPNDSRRISTIISEQFIPATDLILATVKANNTQIMELVNTENVVYSKYNLNPTQFETLITNLALNQDLVAQLANNPNLKNEIISELIPLIDSITTDIGDMNLNTTATDLTGAINETAEVAEQSIKPISGSNIKIQSGLINTTANTAGVEVNYEFPEPFDAPPVVLLTAMRPDKLPNWYARLETRDATGFTMVCFGNSATAYSIAVMWMAIGTKS